MKHGLETGSALSLKQISFAASKGRRVTFHLAAMSEPIVGYVVGADSYHWLVITSEADMYLVHKSAPVIALGNVEQESTLADEPNREKIEQILIPFLQFLSRQNVVPSGTKS